MTLGLPLLLSAAALRVDPPDPLTWSSAGAAAESTSAPPSDLTLAEAFERLRSASPRTAADRSSIETSRAEVVAAKVAPNPQLDWNATRLRSGTNTGAADVDEVSAEWPVLIFGQRKARRDAAESGVHAAEAHVTATYASRARDVRNAFGDLYYEQERVAVLESARADLERVASVVSGRRDAGNASAYDALRVETESRISDAALRDARGDLSDAQGHLAVLLGAPGWSPRASGPIVGAKVDPLDADALWARTSESLPALVAARRDEDAAAAALRSAHRDAWPTPAFTAGVESTRDAQSTSALFGITIPLPVLDRNQGAVARARASGDAAALERKAVEAEARADLDRAVQVTAERRAAFADLDAGITADVPKMREMAETAYREGRGGILELLDALRSLTDARLARLDAMHGLAGAEADLLYLLGRADEPLP